MLLKTTHLIIFFILFLSVPLCFSSAYAQDNYADIYTVGSEGSFTEKNVFTLSERPWLYLRFKDLDPTSAILDEATVSLWTWDSSTYPLVHQDATVNSVWLAFSEDYWKNTIAKEGDWTIRVVSDIKDASGSKSFQGSTGFKVGVVPEPISALLFLTGAAALATFRKKNSKA